MMTAENLLELNRSAQAPDGSCLATVTRVTGGRPYVRFDGDAAESPTRYPVATGVSFAAGNRVWMQAVPGGGSSKKYIIAFRITP